MLQDSLLVTTTSPTLAGRLSQVCGTTLFEMSIDHFSDGEVLIKSKKNASIEKKDIFLVHQFSFGSSHTINEQVFDFLSLVRTLKSLGAQKITTLLPYLPYSRQDADCDGELVGLIRLFVDLCKTAGVDHIFCCDIHNPNILLALSLPVTNIALDIFWADFSQKMGLKNSVFISPDQGGCDRVSAIAKLADASYQCLTKERIGKNRTRTLALGGDVRDTTVVLCDDIIDTGGTAIDAAAMLVAEGAKKVVGFFTHGVLSSHAIDRIERSDFLSVFIADSVNLQVKNMSSKISVVSLDSYLVKFFSKSL